MSEVREEYKMTGLGEIPREWEVRTLSYLAHNRNEKFNPLIDESQRYIALEHINSVTGTINGWSDSKESSSIKSKFYKGDILFGKLRPYLRKYWLAKFDGVCATEILALAPTNKSDSKFLFYTMQQEKVIDFTIQNSFGTKMPRTSWNDLKGIEIAVPPIQEQQKISSILSTVDEQIDETEQLIVKTKELKKGLMQQLLTKGIGHTEFKQTELGEIPVTWEITTLDEVLDVRDGTHDSPKYVNEGIPFVTSKNLRSGKLDFSDINYITETDHKNFSSRSHVENGDILFGMIGTVGNPVIVDLPFEISIKNVALIKFSGSSMNNKFVLEYLNSNFVLEQFKKFSNGGVQKFIALGMIRKLKVLVPQADEQQKIASILSTVDEQIEVYEQEKLKYEELKKGLMQKLLTGQIRVKC